MARDRNDRRLAEPNQRVTPLELFFDLVVVFAITQVTSFLSRNPTWGGLLRGLLLLGTLWWAWAAYAWLTNTVDPEEGAVPLAVLAMEETSRVEESRPRGRRPGKGGLT